MNFLSWYITIAFHISPVKIFYCQDILFAWVIWWNYIEHIWLTFHWLTAVYPSIFSHSKFWKENVNSYGQEFHKYEQNEQLPFILTHWTQKESLNSDGQEFHQYQQYEQSPFILTHWTSNTQRHMTLFKSRT